MAYRFAEFEFDQERGLTRSGELIPLEPLAFELLHYLLRNAGRVVSRDELNERLWDGRIVSDAALSTQVRAVRRALGDDRKQQKFIKTFPRRGFSFVAPIQTEDGVVAAAVPGGAPRRTPRLLTIGAMVLAAFFAFVASGNDWFRPWAGSESKPSLSIAVLPFDNLSGDASRDYIADAFTEDLITDLSRIRDAFVISRSTTFTYRGKTVDASVVAEELGVRYVLEGSLRVDGDMVRINAQLIDGKNSRHLWADRYDQPLNALFDLQDSVTGRIASVLRAELRVAEDKSQEPNVTQNAWDLSLRGNVILYNHQSIADYQQAYSLLSEAVELDPTISSAWTGLSFVHYVASLVRIPGVTQPTSKVLSLEAARRAVEADPLNAEPYWLVGAGLARNGQPEKGMTPCETAIDLNPNMDCGHVCAGLVHMANGAPEKAVPFFETALRLNPMFRPFTKEKYLGIAHLQSGNNDAAIAAFNRALAKAPKDNLPRARIESFSERRSSVQAQHPLSQV